MTDDEPLLPDALAQRLAEASRQVEARNWDSLPVAPAGAGPAPALREAVERVERALHEHEGGEAPLGLRHEWIGERFNPSHGGAELLAREELDAVARDGCFVTLCRQVRIDCSLEAGRWRLDRVEYQKPDLDAVYGTAGSPNIELAVALCRFALRGRWRWLARLTLRWLRDLELPRELTVGLDTRSLPLRQATILRWATEQALQRWNEVARGFTRLVPVEDGEPPAILVQGLPHPVDGLAMGICLDRWRARGIGSRARWAVLQVTTGMSPNPRAFCCSPMEVLRTVEHELGHALGLGHCDSQEGVMGSADWPRLEQRPRLAERWSLRRRQQLARLYRQRAARFLGGPPAAPVFGPEEPAAEALDDEAAVRFPREPSPPRFGSGPADWIELLWEGERRLRRGESRRALACFEAARLVADDPSEAELRLGLTLLDAAGDPARGAEFLERALPHRPGIWHFSGRAYLRGALARACIELGQVDAARWHILHQLRESAGEDLREYRAHLRHWRLPMVLAALPLVLWHALRCLYWHLRCWRPAPHLPPLRRRSGDARRRHGAADG